MDAKQPIDLYATVQASFERLTFTKPLRLKDISRRTCSAVDEGTSADYSQGVSVNESVAIFLDWWGWARPHKRYSFAVFERGNGRQWSRVQSRIERIEDAVVRAIQTLAEHELIGTAPGQGAHS